MPKPTLTTHNGTTIPIGGPAVLDGNYPVTVTAIRPPHDDHDTGKVTIHYEWGATDDVIPGRLRAYISS
jgi:hypothetical protein